MPTINAFMRFVHKHILLCISLKYSSMVQDYFSLIYTWWWIYILYIYNGWHPPMCSHESFKIEDEWNMFLLQITVDSKYHSILPQLTLEACTMQGCFAAVRYFMNMSKEMKYLSFKENENWPNCTLIPLVFHPRPTQSVRPGLEQSTFRSKVREATELLGMLYLLCIKTGIYLYT